MSLQNEISQVTCFHKYLKFMDFYQQSASKPTIFLLKVAHETRGDHCLTVQNQRLPGEPLQECPVPSPQKSCKVVKMT
jgi:hypothetical protein